MFDLDNFRASNRERCIDSQGFDQLIEEWSANDWLVAVAGELGELANLAKKLRRLECGIPGNHPHENYEFLKSRMAEEVADTLTYLCLFCERVNIDISKSTVSKFNEVSRRIGFPAMMDHTGELLEAPEEQ